VDSINNSNGDNYTSPGQAGCIFESLKLWGTGARDPPPPRACKFTPIWQCLFLYL